jgi:ribonucleoside-diphosphate reductase alpha chain
VYVIVAGGVLSAVLVPQIVRASAHADGGSAYINKLLTLALVVIGAATVVATALAPVLAWLYAGSKPEILPLAAVPVVDQPASSAAAQLHIWHEAKKPRPRYLPGYTYSVETPLGKAFVTINENGSNQPFEVFINTAKAGSDTAAVSEAIGRLVSYTLRLASPVEPVKRLHEIVRQMSGIGGGRSLGFGPKRVRSLPDGVAQVLNDYLETWKDRENAEPPANGRSHSEFSAGTVMEIRQPEQHALPRIGDLCPECGEASGVNEEGCRKCYSCGFSEC